MKKCKQMITAALCALMLFSSIPAYAETDTEIYSETPVVAESRETEVLVETELESETETEFIPETDLSNDSVELSTITPSAIVVNFAATGAKKGVLLTWDSISDADGYKILVRRPGQNQITLTETSAQSKSYLDTDAVPGTINQYWIAMKKGSAYGSYSKTSGARLVIPEGVTNLTAKQNVKFTNENLTWTNTISWTPSVSAVDGYVIYRKTGSGSYSFVRKTAQVKWRDDSPSQSEKVYYRIYAFYKDVATGKDILSDDNTFVRVDPYVAPALTTSPEAVSTAKGTQLSWKATKNAHGYVVYKRAGSSGSFVYVGKTKDQKTIWVDKNTDCKVIDYYKIYPYYTNIDGKNVMNKEKTSLYARSNHSYAEATYDAPKTCTKCGKTVGEKLVRKVLMIGDSRTAGMYLYGGIPARDFEYVAASVNTTAMVSAYMNQGQPVVVATLTQMLGGAIVDTLNNQFTDGARVDLIHDIKAYGITDVVYALGVNDLTSQAAMNTGLSRAQTTMQMLDKYTDANLHFLSIFPVDQSRCGVSNSMIISFNQSMQNFVQSAGMNYIDGYNWVNPSETKDGLHYTHAGIQRIAQYLHNIFY